MLSYLARRLLIGIATLFVITFLVFGLTRAMPGNPIRQRLETANPDRPPKEENIRREEARFHYDKPWMVAYFYWLGGVFMGDLGTSYTLSQPVAHAIAERLPRTLLLTTISLSLTYLLAIPMGLYATVRSGKPEERYASMLLYMLYSLPTYVAALFLQIFFAVQLQGAWLELPLFGMTSDNYNQLSVLGKTWDIMRHSFLPITCYTYGSLAYYSRFIRANMQEVIRQDFIRTARAKGVDPLRVLVRHAFSNTMIPLLTMFGLTLPALVGGAIIIEQIFSWEGMGTLFFTAVFTRDRVLLMGMILMFSALTLAGQLLADILYAVADPRVSYS